MIPLNALIAKLIALRASGGAQITLLAVCPNSSAVLEAAIRSAARNQAPLLLAATLNQVDRDGGYTGWTPAAFVQAMRGHAERIGWDGPIYPCLDHGGPWLKDRHVTQGLDLAQSMVEVKSSLEACLRAGYRLLHIDPTVERDLPAGQAPTVEQVVQRCVELMAHAEAFRSRHGLPAVAYEVGSEELKGGLVDVSRFERFLALLRLRLDSAALSHAWPCFVVAQVGTDLHTADFDAAAARRLYRQLAPLGSLAKGHYTDWVANPRDYPASGMGGANLGPEFAAVEYRALRELEDRLGQGRRGWRQTAGASLSQVVQRAVIASQRWRKWLWPEERGLEFEALSETRRDWLLASGSRYIWTEAEVEAARQRLYAALAPHLPDPHGYVVERIAGCIDLYMQAFGLVGTRGLCEPK